MRVVLKIWSSGISPMLRESGKFSRFVDFGFIICMYKNGLIFCADAITRKQLERFFTQLSTLSEEGL